MSTREDFHPALSTLDIAKFQLMESGFAGIRNGVTLIPAKNARAIEANHLREKLIELLDETADKKYIGIPGEAIKLLVACEVFLKQYPENPACAAVVVFRPGIKEGEANVQPVALIIDPWEVVDPEFAHTDGAGNVKEQDGGADNNSGNPRRSNGDGTDP